MSKDCWVSRYALTKGIIKSTAVGITSSHKAEYVTVEGFFGSMKVGTDVHFTLQEAQAAAEQARLKRIPALERSLDKMKNLEKLPLEHRYPITTP